MANGEIVIFWRNLRERSTPILLAESLTCEHDMPGGSILAWCSYCCRWVCLYCTQHDLSDVELACFVGIDPSCTITDVVDVLFDMET